MNEHRDRAATRPESKRVLRGQAFLSRQSSNSLVFEEDGNGEAFVYLLVKRHRWQTDAECKNINEAIPTTFRDVDCLISR